MPPSDLTSWTEPPVRRSELTVYEIDGEALVYDPITQNTHPFNATSLFVWQRCDGRRSAAQIGAELARVYAVDARVALQHVLRVLGDFRSQGLVGAATGRALADQAAGPLAG